MIRTLDYALFRYLNSWAGVSRLGDAVIVFFAHYLAYVSVAAFLLILFFWQQSRQEKIRIFLTVSFSGVVARLGITEAIRFFYHRPRPFLISALQARQLLADNEWSFPSGHAAFFFAAAAAMYWYNKKWGSMFFVASVCITVGRVIGGIHYPSDIVGGMLIGVATGFSVFYFVEKRKVKRL